MELIFLYCVRQRSNLILLHVDVQLSLHHVLKNTPPFKAFSQNFPRHCFPSGFIVYASHVVVPSLEGIGECNSTTRFHSSKFTCHGSSHTDDWFSQSRFQNSRERFYWSSLGEGLTLPSLSCDQRNIVIWNKPVTRSLPQLPAEEDI